MPHLGPDSVARRAAAPRTLLVPGRALLAALLLGLLAGQASAQSRPNVLFIAVDDLRCDLGCFGVAQVKSPNIDRLAASGVLFTRAYCQQAVCNPSRASLMTGLRPDTTHVWDLDTDFRLHLPDAVTIPQHFRNHGYRAVAFGKIFHNTFPDDVSWDEPTHHAQGVVAYSEENQERLRQYRRQMKAAGKPDAAIARMRGPATEIQDEPDDRNYDGKQTTDAIARLRELAAGDAPFFLAVGYIRPHLPFITPKKYWDLYDRAAIPLAANGFLPRGMPPVAFSDRSLGGFYELRGYMDYADAPSPFDQPLTEAQQRELKHGYYASASFIDAQVGRLLDALDQLDLARNTIVVLWGDHGWKLGEHRGWCKQTNFEIDTHAPLMIRAPGARASGRPCARLVEFVDIYPTLCDLADLPIPAPLEGKSLAPLLNDPSAPHKDAAISQFERRHEGRSYMGYTLRTDQHRYVEWLTADDGRIAAQELYDHQSDPDENDNLANRPEHADRLKTLSAKLWSTIPRPHFPLALLQSPSAQPPLANRPELAWHPADGTPVPRGNPHGAFRQLTFVNRRPQPVELWWIGPAGEEKSYARLQHDAQFTIRTRPGAVWLVRDAAHQPLGHLVVDDRPAPSALAIIPE